MMFPPEKWIYLVADLPPPPHTHTKQKGEREKGGSKGEKRVGENTGDLLRSFGKGLGAGGGCADHRHRQLGNHRSVHDS